MVELTHLSYSSINLYLTCSEHWRRKYIEGEKTPSSPALVFGSAFHNTLEQYIGHRAFLIEDVAPSLTSIWSNQWGVQVEAEADCDWGADTPAQHYNEGVRILGESAVQELADSLTPAQDDAGLWIERKLKLQVPGVPIPVIGYLDILTQDGIPGDFKTSKARWSQDKAQQEMQPLVYLAALNQMGVQVPDLKFRHYVITKAKTPQVQVIETEHTVQELFWLFDTIGSVWRSIEKEIFTMNPGAWLCSSRFCGYWSTCRGGGG